MGRRKRVFSKEYQSYLEKRKFWRRYMRTSHVKKCEKHSAKCDCIKEDDLHPPIVQAMRRLRGPTTDDCLDGLTYEETQQIDITKFEVAVRWKPYLAKKPDGTTICLYRLRPMHHDQRSGGVTLDPPYPSPAVETEGHNKKPATRNPAHLGHEADNEESDDGMDKLLINEDVYDALIANANVKQNEGNQARNTDNELVDAPDDAGEQIVLPDGRVVLLYGAGSETVAAEPLDPAFDEGNFSPDDSVDIDLNRPIVDDIVDNGPDSAMDPPLEVHLYDNAELTRYVQDFIRRCNKHRMNKAQRREMWSLASDWHLFDPVEMQSYDTLDRKLKAALPVPIVHWKVKCLESGRVFCGKGTKFPEKQFKNKRRYETRCVWTRIKIRDLIRFHAAQHPDADYMVDGQIKYNKVHLNFTYDGIPNGKSSPDNFHVMGVQFRGCRQVYIPCVRVARRKERKNLSKFLDHFVQECFTLGVHVDYFLADAPMRAFLKCLKGHAGRFSCEYCEAEGECINRRICYPSSTLKKRKRSHLRWLECVQELEKLRLEGRPDTDSFMGVTGRSPLLKLRQFDMVNKAPSDPLHRDWLGICKSTLWRNTVGMSKGGNLSATGRKITDEVSEIYRMLNLPSEFSHRSREVDYPNFKGHEWKSLAVTCFPSICKIVEEYIDHATAHVWLLFIFVILINNGPQWARDDIGEDYMSVIHELLYDQFQDSFGEAACTFNWHAFSHMQDISKSGKPSQLSTEPYESAYGEVQAVYRPGTRSIGLQIVSNMMIKRLNHTQGRACENHLVIAPRCKDVRFDDSIVMDNEYNYYRVCQVERELVAVCAIKTKEWKCPTDTNLPMRYVGVCQYVETSQVQVLLKKTDIVGKGIITADGVVIPLHKELLFS